MCQYCEFRNEKGAKAFMREGKNRIYIKPYDKLNMGDCVITVDTDKWKESISIDFCPFCGRKIHNGFISYVDEKKIKDEIIVQTIKYKNKKPVDII